MKKLKLPLLLLGGFLSLHANAETYKPDYNYTISNQQNPIKGQIVDENNEPMEFVNVVLLTCTDSAFIAGTVTQKDGSFLFEELNAKNGVVKLTSIGYATQAKLVPPTGNFGTITMSPENIMLGEVIVKSHRPITAIKGNALVTNVENSVLAHAGTANDVLAQVPMVLGREGNFEVFGKGTPFIYMGEEIGMVNPEFEVQIRNSPPGNANGHQEIILVAVVNLWCKVPVNPTCSATAPPMHTLLRLFLSPPTLQMLRFPP